MTESQIVQGCRNGNADARRALYDLAGDRVYRLLLRMTRHHETALDLAHDTFIKAFEAIESFHGQSALTTWIHRIAVNEALQHLRRKSAVRLNGQAAAAIADPHYAQKQSELRADVDDAMGRLDAIDRAILILRYQEGLDYKSIAEAAEIPLGTVASRLNRARGRLRELLGPTFGMAKDSGRRVHLTSENATD